MFLIISIKGPSVQAYRSMRGEVMNMHVPDEDQLLEA